MLTIIPAAGKSKRFTIFGEYYQKCLLPYENKPSLSHLISTIRLLGASLVSVVCRESQFNTTQALWELCGADEFHFVDESLVQGPATSLLCGLPEQEDVPVTLVLSDMLLDQRFPLNQVAEDKLFVYKAVEEPRRWCLVRNVAGVTQFLEKPESLPEDTEYRALLGVYKFRSSSLLRDCLLNVVNSPDSSERQFSSAFRLYQEKIGHQFELAEVDQSLVIDLGTVDKFLDRKSVVREFNSIQRDAGIVTKSSNQYPEKLKAESCWLEAPPKVFVGKTPKLITRAKRSGICGCSYSMEFVEGLNLRKVLLYETRDPEPWEGILTQLISIVVWEKENTIVMQGEETFWAKVGKRLFSRTEVRHHKMVDDLCTRLERISEEVSPWHGDLHLANVIRHSSGNLVFVDPRGEYFGHWFYELAKLTHSVLGQYDFIDEDLYVQCPPFFYDEGLSDIRGRFLCKVQEVLENSDLNLSDLYLMTACLFASMIPLHQDRPDHGEMFDREADRFYRLSKENP